MLRTFWLALVLQGGLLAVPVGVSRAQIDEPSACEQRCLEAEAECLDACAAQPNPVECEAACREAAEECRRQCR